MTTFANRNNQQGYMPPNAGGPNTSTNTNSGGYYNAGPGGPGDVPGGMNGQYDQTGSGLAGAGIGQQGSYPQNQRGYGTGGPTIAPPFDNTGNYPDTSATTTTGHHHDVGAGGGLNTGRYVGQQIAGGTGTTGGPGTQTATGHGEYVGTGAGAGTGTGGQGLGLATGKDGIPATEKELVGKVERVAGNVLCSSTLKNKGVEKEREAQALKAQAAELGQAEGLESEAAMRRQRAVAHGADPHHLGHHLGGRNDQGRI